MKSYESEFEIYEKYRSEKLVNYPQFNKSEEEFINSEIRKIRKWGKEHAGLKLAFQLLPLVILSAVWAYLFFYLPLEIESKNLFVLIFSFLHGLLGYSFVVYTLHECSGHQSFRTYPVLEKLMYNLCRIKMADPDYYKKCHSHHHNKLGTQEDCAFTQFISLKRFMRSVLPGAGILFPNDYNIHQDPKRTSSRTKSEIIGGAFILLEFFLLKDHLGIARTILCLVLLSPWFGMLFDRLRETTEHRFMPKDNRYGSVELGLSPLSLIVGGGPWGQPCHFSHHLAPDLKWFQQIWLHLSLKKGVRKEIQNYYFPGWKKVFSIFS